MATNPWTSSSVPSSGDTPLQAAHVAAFAQRRHHQKAKQRENSLNKSTKRAYAVKERDYVTFNYREARGSEDDNTLSNILVRAMQRKTRRREIEEAMKIKQLQDAKRKIEEEKIRCEVIRRRQESKLREMKETHQLRVWREEQWRRREVRRARDNKLADEFRKMRLLRRYFKGFRRLVEISRANRIKARDHYRHRIMQKALSKLVIHRDKEQLWKEQMADNYYDVSLLQKFFARWREEMLAREKREALAVHHHHRRVLRASLWAWRWAALDLMLQRRQDSLRATQHYHRKVLAHGLNAWRKYVTGRRRRRSSDVVGTRLRGLVKDIVPDFSPSSSSDDDDDNERGRKYRDWLVMAPF